VACSDGMAEGTVAVAEGISMGEVRVFSVEEESLEVAKRSLLGCLLGLGPEEVDETVELSDAHVVVEDQVEEIVLLVLDSAVVLLMASSQLDWLPGPPGPPGPPGKN
jgi:hypothetical protein